MQHYDSELNTNGMNCPLPILKTKKAIIGLDSGQVIKVTATDPGSVKDMESFCSQTGNTLVAQESEGQDFVFYIRKH